MLAIGRFASIGQLRPASKPADDLQQARYRPDDQGDDLNFDRYWYRPAEASTFSPSHQGVSTEVTDSLIRRIPQLNRNITDLVKLTPQVSVPSTGGPTAGGQYNRYNNFTIDGANQNDRFSLNSSGGLPGGAGGGRIISQEAVKEFRVLLSPTDVRQANFTGMLVNAVTKSGTTPAYCECGLCRGPKTLK